jgi:hypothetical protein
MTDFLAQQLEQMAPFERCLPPGYEELLAAIGAYPFSRGRRW